MLDFGVIGIGDLIGDINQGGRSGKLQLLGGFLSSLGERIGQNLLLAFQGKIPLVRMWDNPQAQVFQFQRLFEALIQGSGDFQRGGFFGLAGVMSSHKQRIHAGGDCGIFFPPIPTPNFVFFQAQRFLQCGQIDKGIQRQLLAGVEIQPPHAGAIRQNSRNSQNCFDGGLFFAVAQQRVARNVGGKFDPQIDFIAFSQRFGYAILSLPQLLRQAPAENNLLSLGMRNILVFGHLPKSIIQPINIHLPRAGKLRFGIILRRIQLPFHRSDHHQCRGDGDVCRIFFRQRRFFELLGQRLRKRFPHEAMAADAHNQFGPNARGSWFPGCL